MRKLITITLGLGLLLAFSPTAQAHCGACGTGADHSKATKTSVKSEYTNIIETAKSAGQFTTLLAAIDAAGLNEALSGDGPFTVFAPTDEAFAALPAGTVEGLLKDKETLTSILTYHVINGKVKADKVVGLDKAETLNGQMVSIETSDNKVMIDGAQVVVTDIICSNGVIHVIDKVILPKKSNS